MLSPIRLLLPWPIAVETPQAQAVQELRLTTCSERAMKSRVRLREMQEIEVDRCGQLAPQPQLLPLPVLLSHSRRAPLPLPHARGRFGLY